MGREPAGALDFVTAGRVTLVQCSAEVAAAAGVNGRTLRYFERRGLLSRPDRLDSGCRMRAPDAVRIVHFGKRAQRLAFALKAGDALLALPRGGPDRCNAAQRLAGHRIFEFDGRLIASGAMRHSLLRLADARAQTQRERRLLQALSDDSERDR